LGGRGCAVHPHAAPRRTRCTSLSAVSGDVLTLTEPTMTTQTAAHTHAVNLAAPALASLPKAHADQHTAAEFPHRVGDHGPNLATLDQLRANGRNALLSPRHRRRAKPAGCTSC